MFLLLLLLLSSLLLPECNRSDLWLCRFWFLHVQSQKLKIIREMIFRTALKFARKHPALIPQIFFMVLGMGGASLYLIRLAKGPHVTWNKSGNQETWNEVDPTFQYKFFAINNDYKKLKKEGPDF